MWLLKRKTVVLKMLTIMLFISLFYANHQNKTSLKMRIERNVGHFENHLDNEISLLKDKSAENNPKSSNLSRIPQALEDAQPTTERKLDKSSIEMNKTVMRSPRCFLERYCVNYIINPQSHCPSEKSTQMLVFILNTGKKYKRRQMVRSTWGNTALFNETTLRVVFIIGLNKSSPYPVKQLKEEAAIHNDIVVADFIEDYTNLTLKTFVGLQWALDFCPNARFLIKADEDVFINSLAFLSQFQRMERRNNNKKIIMGKFIPHAGVKRKGKYQVSEKMFRGRIFPGYCQGPAYIFSKDAAQKVFEQALQDNTKEQFPMEDIYYTGILPQRANISPFMMLNKGAWWMSYNKLPPESPYEGGSWRVFVWHEGTKLNKPQLWETLQYARTKTQLREQNCFLGIYCVSYITTPKGFCHKTKEPKLLAFVLSGMNNTIRRNNIRKTWANQTVFGEADLKVVFIIGKGKGYVNVSPQLQKEAETYNDLVIADFDDNYNTLTLKTLIGLHWTRNHCANAQFVLKTDDDVFINMFSFQNLLNDMLGKHMNQGVIMGHVSPWPKVPRKGRYAISRKDFSQAFFPLYCGGSGYILSADVVKKLYELAIAEKATRLFKLEDVYLTGILATRANIKRVNIARGYVFKQRPLIEERWRDYLVWHGSLNRQSKKELWQTLLRLSGTRKLKIGID